MNDVLLTIAAALAGYLVGTFPTADLVTQLATRGRVDIRAAGSGNPGGLNAMKVVGAKWGVFVIVVDIVKGVVAGLLGWLVGDESGAYAGATAGIAGHIFPVWSRFRGGKGVATSGGAVLVVFPIYFPVDAAVAAIGALSTHNSERAIWISAPVWVGAALGWWLADLPNLWGPEPSVGLPISAAVGAGMILGKFIAARRPPMPAPA
ncbi:MAG: glycerol-3-phosphate acyltransferase [Acidimicrobiia bacterium]